MKKKPAAAAAHAAPARTAKPAGHHPLLATRNVNPSALYGENFGKGTRVLISSQCGDFGEDNAGVVQCVATEPDEKGRYFVGVLPDGLRTHNGRPEQKTLRAWGDYEKGHPPLPAFEVGLVTPTKEKDEQ